MSLGHCRAVLLALLVLDVYPPIFIYRFLRIDGKIAANPCFLTFIWLFISDEAMTDISEVLIFTGGQFKIFGVGCRDVLMLKMGHSLQ